MKTVTLQFPSRDSRTAFALSVPSLYPSEVLMAKVYRLEIIVHPDMLESVLRKAAAYFQAFMYGWE